MRILLTAHHVDTPLARLTAPELFVITSVRLWVAPFRHPSIAVPDWQEGFHYANLDQAAAPSFDTLIRIIAASSRRNLDVRWHCCPLLGEAESRLLYSIALLQRKRLDESYAFISEWLSPPAARVALDPGERLAISLLKAGLAVPLGRLETEPSAENAAHPAEQEPRLLH